VIERTGVRQFLLFWNSVKRERSGSVGNERVPESGENEKDVQKPTVSLHIYGRPYNIVQLYLNGSILDPDSLLTGSLLNQKAVYGCVLQGPIA
jgi:hypothetical protein